MKSNSRFAPAILTAMALAAATPVMEVPQHDEFHRHGSGGTPKPKISKAKKKKRRLMAKESRRRNRR